MARYAVAGRPRCGTSCMMHCLQLGGIPAIYDQQWEDDNQHRRPGKNPYYYEMTGRMKRKNGGKPIIIPDGYVGKCFGVKACNQPPPIHVVYMARNPDSQAASYADMGLPKWNYALARDWDITHLMDSDAIASLVVVEYEDLIEDPLREFTRLAEASWPIDPEKAASGVDKTLKHF